MSGYADVFGGSTVQPSEVQFRAVALSANLVTVWPAFATSGNQCARIMKVTPTAGGFSVSLPDATLTSAGQDTLFDNPSSYSFTVLDFAGNVVATVAAGQVKYLYLSDNSTQAGTWRTTIFGVGSSTLDAASLAGYGVKALANTISTAAVVVNISGNTTVTMADRSKVFVWTGGTGTLTLLSTTGSTSDFGIEVHNQGSGILTVTPTGGSLIDGSGTIALSINESCFIHMGATDWYTVGRGRNVQFNFTQLNKTVTGGTVSLTLTEASNVVQKYSGTLTSNQIVNQPAVVQVYYVSNATTGAYTLTFGCVGGGTTVAVVQGQAAILFCDGTNIINANTSLSGGISSIVFGNGSVTTPSAAFGTSTTGFYVTGSNEIGVTNNGVYAGKFTAGGYQAAAAGAVALQAISSGGTAGLVADRPAGNVGSTRWRTAGVDRWAEEVSATAEGGSNAGSNFALNAYSDAGALLGTAFTVNRATQVVSFAQPPVLDATNVTNTIAPQTHAATTKATPVDADELPITDSAASFGLKKLTWANLKATILAWLQATVFPAPGAIGATTPAAGAFTTLSASDGTNGNMKAYVDVNYGFVQSLNQAMNAYRALKLMGSNFVLSNGTTDQVIVDTSGNLGLGVVPSGWGSNWKATELANGSSFAATISGNNSVVLGNAYNNGIGFIYKVTAGASYYNQTAGTHTWNTAPSGTAGNPITFTQAMTLDANGNLLVAQTAAGANANGHFLYAGGVAQVSHASGTASGTQYATYFYNGSSIGSITQSGTTAVLYNTTSDYRLKANQQPLTGSGAFIDALKPTTWEWTRDGRKDAGFLAHEFQEVCPNAVNGVKDEMEDREYEVTPAVPATDTTEAVPAVMGTRSVPKYQSMQASSAEVIANLVAELQDLRRRLAALESK
jgi:hypothetical protein